MEALREITEWTGVEYRSPNHDYLLDGDKIIAYRPWGTAEIRVLRSGIKIDLAAGSSSNWIQTPLIS